MPHAVPLSSSGETRHHIDLSDLKPDTYKAYIVASARLYHTPFGAAQGDWTYSQKGLLVFGRDRGGSHKSDSSSSLGSYDSAKYWFRLVDEISGRTVWMFKAPVGLDYQKDKPFFHVFTGKSRMFGFCFDHDDEAAQFFEKVRERTSPKPKPKSKRQGGSSSLFTFVPSPAESLRSAAAASAKSQNTNTRDTKKPKPSLSRKGRISTSIISAPSPESFVHVAHVGIDENGTIESLGKLDSSWDTLIGKLQGYGISQSMVEENLDFVEGFLAGAKSAKKHSNRNVVNTEFQAPASSQETLD